MKYLILVCLAFSSASCLSSTLFNTPQINTEDCVTRHLKVLIRKEQVVNPEMYEHVADVCRSIHTNRP